MKYGSNRIDGAGNQKSCAGKSIRNEDVVYLMQLVVRSLQLDQQSIISSLASVIQTVMERERTGKDDEKEKDREEKVQEMCNTIRQIVCGNAADEVFYGQILNHMVIHDRGHVDVYLQLLPIKWSYVATET